MKCNECEDTKRCHFCGGGGTIPYRKHDFECMTCGGTGECQYCKRIFQREVEDVD